MFVIFFLIYYICITVSDTLQSPADCCFDALADALDSGFCGWRPSDFSASQIWHTGNAVLVDSANFVVRTSSNDASGSTYTATGTNRFAYVQGQFGAGTEGVLESPVLTDAGAGSKELKLTYWKVAPLPTLDICVKDLVDESLNCVDAITGPGQHQWILRSVEIPSSDVPYKIILRARGILSAEDIICVDDIQLIDSSLCSSPNSEAITNEVDVVRRAEPFKDDKSRQDEFVMGYHQQMQLERDQETNRNDGNEKERNKIPTYADGFEEQALIPLQQSPAVAPAPNVEKMSRPSIRPQLRHKLASVTVFPKEPPPPDFTKSETVTHMSKWHPAIKNSSQIGKERQTNYPEFSSFADGMNAGSHQWKSSNVASPEPVEFCKAIKCSFLEDSCLWTLGWSWKKAGGSIVRDTAGEDFVRSALFKVPLGSFIEFDLWMSDDSHFLVVQEMSDLVEEHITLFSHRGMASNGFNRFRVPLRPSFRPARIRLRSILPVNAFVTVSNTRMVDGRHEEIACETILSDSDEFEKFVGKKSAISESTPNVNPKQNAFTATPPLTSFANLFTNTLPPFPTLPTPPPFSFDLLTPPTTTYSQLQQLSPDFMPDTTTSFSSIFPTLAPFLAPTPPTPIFNPFKPMLESGITPIMPLKGEPPRLTAFQKGQLSATSKDSGRSKLMSANEAFRHFSSLLPNVWPEAGQSDNNEGHIWSPSVPKKQKPSHPSLKTAAVGENELQSDQRLHDLGAEDAPISASFSRPEINKITDKFENRINSGGFIEGEKRTLGQIISSIAGQPALEQQLRQLAQQFGFDANQVPDQKTLKKIRGFFGSKLFTLEKLGTLPASVSSTSKDTESTPFTDISSMLPLGAISSVRSPAVPPPSPFEAPEPSFMSPNDFIKSNNKIDSQQEENLSNNFNFEQVDPIRPIKNR